MATPPLPPRLAPLALLLGALLALLIATACGGAAPLELTVEPGTLHLARDSSRGVAVAFRGAGATPAPHLRLAESTLPAGISYAFEPARLGAAGSVLTLTATAEAPLGVHRLTLEAASAAENGAVLARRTLELVVEKPFLIERIEAPEGIAYNGEPGRVAVSWSGSPTFPVTLDDRPLPGDCELDACTDNLERFAEAANPLVFHVSCRCEEGVCTGGAFGYRVTLTDANGVRSPPATYRSACVNAPAGAAAATPAATPAAPGGASAGGR